MERIVTDRFERTLAWAGVVAGVLYAAKFALNGMPQTADAGSLAHVHDHQVQNGLLSMLTALTAILVALFATGLRSRLRSGEGAESTYSSIAYSGGVLLAGAMLLRAWTILAALDATSGHDSASVRTIVVLSKDLWVPWIAATSLLLLGVGLGGLRNAVLPRWLSWVSIVLAVMCLLGPIGILVDLLMPAWLIVTGFAVRRDLRGATGPETSQVEVAPAGGRDAHPSAGLAHHQTPHPDGHRTPKADHTQEKERSR